MMMIMTTIKLETNMAFILQFHWLDHNEELLVFRLFEWMNLHKNGENDYCSIVQFLGYLNRA